MKTEEYFKDSELSVDAFEKKYKIDDEEYEDVIERVVDNVAKMEGFDNEGFNNGKLNFADITKLKKYEYWKNRWKKEILNDVWKPAGSIMAGVGNPIKNISTANCTSIGIDGDTLEDISEARYKLMKFAAYRQGIGLDFSNLRPAGAKIGNSAKVSNTGALNWMEDFNEAARHVGQCIHPDMMVLTKENGWIRIKDIVENQLNVNVVGTKDWVKVVDWFKNGKKEMIKIVTEYGNEIIVSKDHKIAVPTNGEIITQKAIELRIGDWVVAGFGYRINDGIIPIPKFEYKYSKYNNSNRLFKPSKTPEFIDNKLAYLIGYIYGNGSYYKNVYGIAIPTSWPEIKNKLNNILNDLFGVNIGDYGINIKKPKNENVEKIELGKYISSFLIHIGIKKEKALNLTFPSILKNAPSNIIESFFAGLIDADGYSSKKKSNFEIVLIADEFLEELKRELGRIGYVVKLKTKNNKTSIGNNVYRLSLVGLDNINRMINTKYSIKLLYGYQSNYQDRLKTPFKAGYMGINVGKLKRKDINSTEFLSYRKYNKYLNDNINLYIQKIKSIENYGVSESYDLSIDSNDHLYIVNGLFVSNSGRVPALLYSLHDDHPDFPEFITAKSDLKKIENANISIQMSDAFMHAVENDEDWEMTFQTPHETIVRKEKARDLYKKILENNLNFSEPGVQFKDTIHEYSNSDYVGWPVVSSNACSEKFLDPSGVCNLASFNLEKFPTDKVSLNNYLADYAPSLVRFLDNVIDYEIYSNRAPLNEQVESQRALRRLGIGFLNLHAWLLKVGVDYGSAESIELVEYLAERLMYHTYRASIELGKEKGSFLAFDKTKFEQSPYIKQMKKLGLEFNTMRNVETLAIAPNGTTALMVSKPVFSYGIEPAFGLYYWKRTRISGHYEYYFVVPNIVYEILKENDIDLKEKGLKALTIKDTFDGRIGKPIAKIIDDNKHLFNFKPAKDIKPEDKIKLMSSIAKYIDSSISTTYILPENATTKNIDTIIKSAWKNKIKSVSIYRDATRYGIVEFVPFKERVEQLYKEGYVLHEHELSDEDVKMLSFNPFENKKYSMIIDDNNKKLAKIIKFKAEGGDKFYIILRNDEKQIFITNYKIENRSNERILAIANRLGNIVKEKNEKEYYKQLERSENTLSRFTRMLSTALKLDLKNKALEILDEYAIVGNLAWYLTKRVFNYNKEIGQKCPICNIGTMIPTDDGCSVCDNCGYSRCD